MENEQDTIDSIELKAMLGVTGQQLKYYKWLPERIGNGPRKIIIWNRQDVMAAIKEHWNPAQKLPAVKYKSWQRHDTKQLINNVMAGRQVNYRHYDKVQNKGDIMLALRLKQEHPEKPYLYESRRDSVECHWIIK